MTLTYALGLVLAMFIAAVVGNVLGRREARRDAIMRIEAILNIVETVEAYPRAIPLALQDKYNGTISALHEAYQALSGKPHRGQAAWNSKKE